MAAIFEDSVSGLIPASVVKINKMVESKSPWMGVNEVCFLLIFFNNSCIILKVNNYTLTKNKPIYHAQNVNR